MRASMSLICACAWCAARNFIDAARKWFAKHGYDAAYGARPMARLIDEKIRKRLADEPALRVTHERRQGQSRPQRRRAGALI